VVLGAGAAAAIAAASAPLSRPSSYLAGPFGQSTVDRFVRDLASVGIGVYEPGAAGPVRPIRGRASPLGLTVDQARDLALGAWSHAGLNGATLDGLAGPVRLLPGRGLGEGLLVAAWAKRARTPSAALARRVLGRVNWKRYRAVVFPTVVPLLFASDVVTHLGGGRKARAVDSTLAAAGPCSAVQNFLAGVVDNFFAAIGHVGTNQAAIDRLFGSGFLGSIIKGVGDILSIGVNATLDAAHRIVLGVVKIPARVIANAVAGVAAVVDVVGSVAAILDPWTGTIMGSPNPISKGVGGGVPGTFKLTVTAPGGNLEWPPAIADCAQTFGITLPTLTPRNADVTWDISNQDPGGLIIRKSDTGPLDNNGTAKLAFESTTETPAEAKGDLAIGAVVVFAKIHRKDLDQLRDRLTQTLFANLPKIVQDTIGPTLRAILTPLINTATQRIAAIQDIEAAGVEAVRYHVPKPPPTGKRPSKHKPRRRTEDRYPVVDACSLLTSAEVHSVLAADVVGPTPHAFPGRYPTSGCGWHANGAELPPFPQGVIVVTDLVARYPDVATATKNSLSLPGDQRVAGLGDEAFWTPAIRQLKVRKANLHIIIGGNDVGGMYWTETVAASLMRDAFAHLPAPARVQVSARTANLLRPR
jgi:hypothetical protein